MLPEGCQAFNVSSIILWVAILGSQSTSLDDWITKSSPIRMFIPCRNDVGTYFWNVELTGNLLLSSEVQLNVTKWSGVLHAAFAGEFQPSGIECLIKPWFEADSSARCTLLICSFIGSFGGTGFHRARLSKPKFAVTSNALFKYA